MNSKYKPFRFITPQELIKLQQHFTKKILLWNEQHALFPVSCSLECASNIPKIDTGHVLMSEHYGSIAVFPLHDLSLIKYSLFGDLSKCFDNLSTLLQSSLLDQLFETQTLLHQSSTFAHDEWFYTGSPALSMTLNGGEYTITMYLHPRWVLNALPKPKHVKKELGDLHAALDLAVLQANVELIPLSLQFSDVAQLRIGDVIQSDHPLTTPILLKNKQQTICHAELGTINSYKSIQITSSL